MNRAARGLGSAAGDPTKGYYSFDVGSWHIVDLNRNCVSISGGCGAGSPQEAWLRADLAAHSTPCALASTFTEVAPRPATE